MEGFAQAQYSLSQLLTIVDRIVWFSPKSPPIVTAWTAIATRVSVPFGIVSQPLHNTHGVQVIRRSPMVLDGGA